MAAPGSMEASLEAAHKHLGRAAFCIVYMIVKRRFYRAWSDEALYEARRGIAILENLDPKRIHPQ